MAIGALVGGAGGAILAPKDERKEVHAGVWALIGAGLIAIYKVVTDQKKKQNQELKDEVHLLKNRPEFKTIDTYKVKHDKPLFPGGPTSGTWHFKKANQWVPDGRGRLLHYTEEFKRADEDEKKNEK